MGSLLRRGASSLIAVGALALLAGAGSGSAQETARGSLCGGGSTLAIDLRTTSQERILDRGKLRAEVENCAGGKAKIRFAGKSRDAAGAAKIARSRDVTFRGTRVVGLRLSKAGARRLARCVEQELVFRGVGTAGGADARGRDAAPLELDSEKCAAPGSSRVYNVDPGSDATHTNGTPRELDATGTGSDQVLIATFACANVSESGGELVFAAQDGAATQGSSGAGVSEVNGQAQPGNPPKAGPASAQGNKVSFEITGSDGCARPVVFRDVDADGVLDVDADGVPTERYGGGGETTFEAQGVAFQNADRCDPTDPAVCLYPWPNDHFTTSDASTDTGRRIALQSDSMPRNRAGIPIDPADYNRNDGFSPGQLVVTKIPGLETPEAFANTGSVPVTDLGAYADEDAPIVVIDAATGERHPIFTELDANPADPADVAMLIRPSVNWEEGHRYVVALRNLRDGDDNPIPAQRAFRLYRDDIVTSDTAVEARRAEFEQNFDALEAAGIEREELYLSWDFTVASERNLSERMLSIRDDAFAELGDENLSDLQAQGSAPNYLVTDTTDYGPCGNDGCAEDPITGEPTEDDRIARQVDGVVAVPCYLDAAGCPTGSKFALDANGLPQQNPVPHLAQFRCLIPRSAVDGGPDPARPSLYGHGLLGSHEEVSGGNIKAMANEHNFVFCATDWAGFATTDAPSVLASLQDLSNFPRLADRMQQGYLNFMYLGRLLIHPQGFGANAAFRSGGEPLLDTTRLYYDGNSQGGIMGGGLTAVAPDYERAVLGVPAMNYSTLLRRSSDFAPYAEGKFCGAVLEVCEDQDTDFGLYDNYPNELERPLILSMIQMLWDRGEANGYAHHMTTDPLPDTPAHKVLMHVAFGDHQVTNVAADVEARTIGASTNVPSLDPGRIPGGEPLWSIPAIPSFPFDGSAIVYYDSGPPRDGDQGVLNPPTTNTPPGDPSHGRDPHSDPRNDPNARTQKSEFLRPDGRVVDVCGGKPCYAHGWTGPPGP